MLRGWRKEERDVQETVDASGTVSGVVVHTAPAVAEDGQSLTRDYTIEFTEADGATSGQMGPGRASGTRITLQPMGTPVATAGPSRQCGSVTP